MSSTAYSNISIAIHTKNAPEPTDLSMYYNGSSIQKTKRVGKSRQPYFNPIVLTTAFHNPLKDCTFPDMDSYIANSPLRIYGDTEGF